MTYIIVNNPIVHSMFCWSEEGKNHTGIWVRVSTVQKNTIQCYTIQCNTICLSVCQCLLLCFYFIRTRPSFNAVESMDASTWIWEPKPRIIIRGNIYDVLVCYNQSLLLLEVEWIKSIWPFLITHINNYRFQSFVLCIPKST